MARLCANISLLFRELPLVDRIAAAAEAGFDGVEILFPYDENATTLVEALQAADMPLVLINAPPPNYTGGPRGFAAVPGSEDRFRRDFTRVLRYAGRMKPRHIHIMCGATDAPEARAVAVENLRWAADQAPKQSLTIEPLNGADMPGYFLNDFDLAAGIIAEVDRPNLALQYDTYHAQMIHGDAVAVWRRHAKRVAHVQLGDAPGRHEPGADNVDFDRVFAELAASGYAGWISGEYNPTGDTLKSLGWMQRAG